MAPPNPFWVQRYLRDHNIDALLADAVNQVCSLRDCRREGARKSEGSHSLQAAILWAATGAR